MCIYGSPYCPFTPCDDGNSLTYDDEWDANGSGCYGTYCSGACTGLPCDDGDALTFADAWADADGTSCTGLPCAGVDCSGAGPCAGVSHVLYDRKAYALVEIGSQCWFKENLASDNYRNGDAIPGGLTDSQWTTTLQGAQTYWGEGWWWAGTGVNLSTYGRLYNFYAVADPRGLCPAGYHVPSDDEWSTLTNFLGGDYVADALKSSPTDVPAWDGTNSSGFSALPGGFRSASSGYFGSLGDYGYWWGSSPSGSFAWFRLLYSGGSFVYRSSDYGRFGFSVRCVRD
jgi:uncharacterized protein (TIGR02145 family)